MREQVLYQIFKLSSEQILKNNLKIENYRKKDAIKDGALVSLGDNILFDRIRNYNGDTRDPKEIFERVQILQRSLRRYKKDGELKKADVIAQELYDTLFVKEIVNVVATTKSSFRKVAKAGFFLNGSRYVAFACGAGQCRRSVVTFIKADMYDYMFETLSCGIDKKVKEINLAKFNAYFALTTSSVLWVDTPKCCVIKDFETDVPNQKVDWIEKNENGEGVVVEKLIDFKLNSCDGQGLVCPEWADHWAENMGLDYTPSEFVVRSAYIKGLFAVFDFKEYAKRHGIVKIKDIYGVEYNVDEIDCLISESQFKMYKYYDSWQEYLNITTKNGIKWGIARYNKKEDPVYTMFNYQFLQILDLSKEDVTELIRPTIEWINKICSGDDLYSLLYSFGGFNYDDPNEIEYADVFTRAQNIAMKAVVKNKDFLKDAYVQRKIYKNIVEVINRAKIGKIWQRGNYQFCVSDPIAQCRSALGLEPKGEVPADYIYSNFWNNLGVTGEVFIGRNPCIDEHEANKSTIYRSNEADYWYRYLKSGLVFSIYDTTTIRNEDSDFDGDIYASYDNPILVKGSKKDQTNVISYDKKKAPLQKINHANIIEAYIKGFGNKVGTYSNHATIIEAMKAQFSRPEQKQQRDELERRKKLLREIVGAEIDSTKGLAKPKEPWYFKTKLTIDPDDDDATKAEKFYHNSLVICKKPYFFRYLYPELNEQYKQYEKLYNDLCKTSFQTKLKKLMVKPDKTPEEIKVLKRYHRFSPLINSNCTMNILCRQFEDVDFDIQYAKDNYSALPYIEEYEFEDTILTQLKKMYQRYSNKKTSKYVNEMNEIFTFDDDDYREIKFSAMDAEREEMYDEFKKIGITTLEGLTYIRKLSQQYNKFNWAFAWDLFGEDILDCIETGDALAPVQVPAGEGEEYFGKYYKLLYIPKEDNKYSIDEETGEIIYVD